MHLVDTHIHLYAEEFHHDRAALIEKALHNGVQHFYLPNIDSSSIEGMLQLEKLYPGHCFAMMGLHPCSVKQNVKEELEVVKTWLEKRSFAAIGEIGMDLFWDKTFQAEQEKAFKLQVNWALDYNYPIVIHVRNAFPETLKILKEFKRLPKGIFHCFSGTEEDAKAILDLGEFKLGIGGVLTFKNSGLEKALQSIDLQHLVLETDAPYLAPVPFRGKRNEPVYILEVAKKLAALKNTSLEEVATISSQNANALFNNR